MKERILVADDMMMDREVLTELLSGEFDVTAVEDGAKAIEALDAAGGAFACILLDIFMPVKDGFAVLDHIHGKGYSVPVIALTSLTDSEGHIRCYEAGVSEILEKPYDRKILIYKVRRMIEGKREKVKGEGQDGNSALHLQSSPSPVLFNAFREDFAKNLRLLKQAIADGDDRGLHAAAHAFTGLEANLGVLIDG